MTSYKAVELDRATPKAYKLEAIEMFIRAKLDHSAKDVIALANDLHVLAAEEYDADDPTNGVPHSENAYAAAVELRKRIGGFDNLRSYVNCLIVHVA